MPLILAGAYPACLNNGAATSPTPNDPLITVLFIQHISYAIAVGGTGSGPIFSVNAHLQKVHFYLWDYIFLY